MHLGGSNHEKESSQQDNPDSSQQPPQAIQEDDFNPDLRELSAVAKVGQLQQRPNSMRLNGNGGILFTSVIHTGVRQHPLMLPEETRIMSHSQSVTQSMQLVQVAPDMTDAKSKLNLPIPPYGMSRSVTCSTLQTDI